MALRTLRWSGIGGPAKGYALIRVFVGAFAGFFTSVAVPRRQGRLLGDEARAFGAKAPPLG